MKKIRFGIIGYGHIGKRHAQRILENEQAELIAVCDNKEHEMEEAPSGVFKTTDHNELLQIEKIDVVCVATPNYLHAPMSVDSLNKGKHVLCEKPMALNVLDTNKMILAAQRNKRELFVVKQNRFNPPIQKTKELLEKNALGDILFFVINCFWNRNADYYLNSDWKGSKEKYGGTLFTQFSHFIDIAYFLFGDFVSVQAIGENMNHADTIEFEDTGVINFELANGSLGSLNYTTCSYKQNLEGSISIFGTKGTMKIGGQYLNVLDYYNIEDVTIKNLEPGNPSNDYGFYQGSMSNHDISIANVINTINGKEVIATSAFEGMKVVQLIESAYESMISGKKIRIR